MSRSNISENALKVLYRLQKAGFKAELVGGSVRDLLLGRHPKDFDVATNALPEEVRGLFNNCRLIGRRFRLAHVHFGRDLIEVATYRADSSEVMTENLGRKDSLREDHGMIMRDNVYGTQEEDAWRRDFTVNALYYDVSDFSVHAYAGGLEDLKQRIIRIIGDAEQRYREDPVRMLRAVRFAAKLGFSIEEQTAKPLFEMGPLLQNVSSARLFEEVLKLFYSGHGLKSFRLMREYGLFAWMFPQTEHSLKEDQTGEVLKLIEAMLENTDTRLQEGKSVTPAFLFAAFLWHPMLDKAKLPPEGGSPLMLEMVKAGSPVIGAQMQITSVPKRFTSVVRDIWGMQSRLEKYSGKRALRLLASQRFRASYDFLCLRAQAGAPVQERSEWWTMIQEQNPEEQARAADQLPSTTRRRRRRKKAS